MGGSEGDDNGEGTSEIGDEGDDRENDEGGGKRMMRVTMMAVVREVDINIA